MDYVALCGRYNMHGSSHLYNCYPVYNVSLWLESFIENKLVCSSVML